MCAFRRSAFACLGTITFLIAGPARADETPDPAALVRQGNTHFAEQAFEDALARYDLAAEAVPDSPELAFNRGLTQFKLNRLDEAAVALNQAVLSQDRSVEARSKFLLGNIRHLQAVQARGQNPQAAIESLEQATQYYLDALALTPEDDNLRANVELAQGLIELIRQQMEQQPQQNQQQQGDEQNPDEQQDAQQDQQQEGDEQNPDEQQQSQEQPEQGDEEDEPHEEPGEEQQQQDARQGEQQEQQQAQPAEQNEQDPEQEQARMISKEQAERMFQQIRDKERQRRLERARRSRRNARPVKRDW